MFLLTVFNVAEVTLSIFLGFLCTSRNIALPLLIPNNFKVVFFKASVPEI